MKHLSIAPCGVICELCIGYQRTKNKCVGCNAIGNKTNRCMNCTIKNCKEKSNPKELCIECKKFPCRLIKNLEKRYSLKYNESPTENMHLAKSLDSDAFDKAIKDKWTCPECGNLLSAHSKTCIICGHKNSYFPQ